MKILVLGNSPSLQDVDLARAGGTISVGVNRILEFGFAVDYLLIVDEDVYREQRRLILKHNPKMILWKPLRNKIEREQGDGHGMKMFSAFNIDRKVGNKIHLDGRFFASGNTATYAVEAAYRMCGGRGVVGLIGVDLHYESTEHSHFWGDGLKRGCRPFFHYALEWFGGNAELFNGNEFSVFTLSPRDGPLKRIIRYMEFDKFIA